MPGSSIQGVFGFNIGFEATDPALVPGGVNTAATITWSTNDSPSAMAAAEVSLRATDLHEFTGGDFGGLPPGTRLPTAPRRGAREPAGDRSR